MVLLQYNFCIFILYKSYTVMDKLNINKQLITLFLIIVFTVILYYLVHYIGHIDESFEPIISTELTTVQIGNTIPQSVIVNQQNNNILYDMLITQETTLSNILSEINQFIQLPIQTEVIHSSDPSYFHVKIDGEPGNQTIIYTISNGNIGSKGNPGPPGIKGIKGLTGEPGDRGMPGYHIS